eukprot:TRINITY_DN1521_c0_g2_i1.p1 TRINITY_DN1521_c0_g2~~TRINITY_DN1521_c0_g2_i1.p1  ORF type:complete len:941 (+),score=213.68 TRINITY_DN1521_c0_g2_i1:78-2825(+)
MRAGHLLLLLLSQQCFSLPGHTLPTPDSWWTKRITADIHTSGLLSEEDILAARRAGFRSILSVWNLPRSLGGSNSGVSTRDTWGTPGVFRLTAAEKVFVEGLGMSYLHVQPWCPTAKDARGNDLPYCEPAVLDQISAFMLRTPKPILVHCQISRLATGAAKWHLYRSGGYDAAEFFATSQVTPGWDYTRYLNYDGMWANLTGYFPREGDVPTGSLHPRLRDFRPAWKTQRVTDGMYVAGAIAAAYVPTLASAGFDSIVNLEVADNAALRAAATSAGIEYAHVPLQWPLDSSFGSEQWAAVAAQLQTAGVGGSGVHLIFDDTGSRSMAAAVLVEAQATGQDAAWCMRTALRANYFKFSDDAGSQPFKLFLDVAGGPKPKASGGAGGGDCDGYVAALTSVAAAAAALVVGGVWARSSADSPHAVRAKATVVRSTQEAMLGESPGSVEMDRVDGAQDAAAVDYTRPGARLLQLLLLLAALACLASLCVSLGAEEDVGGTAGAAQPDAAAGADGDGSSVAAARRLLQAAGGQRDGSWRALLLLFLGVGLGALLDRSDFAFTRALRRFILRGKADVGGVRELQSIWLMLILVSAAYLPLLILSGSYVDGRAAVGWVNPIGVPLVVGSAVFGVGQQLAGGCGSGCVSNASTGSALSVVVLLSFVCGSVLGGMSHDWWKDWPESDGFSFVTDMPRGLGTLLHFLILAVPYYYLCRWDDGSADDATAPTPSEPNALRKYRVFRRIGDDGGVLPAAFDAALFGPVSLNQAAAGLAALNLLVMLTRNQPWGITFAFSEWGANLLESFGAPISDDFGYYSDLRGNVFASDGTSPIVFGMLIGAVLSAVVSRDAFMRGSPRPPLPVFAAGCLGGLLLGIGARMARGCNIGAFVSGVASFSGAAWVWFVCNALGNVVGVHLRPLFRLP